MEQLLLDILHDLIDAQSNGESAEFYFGRDSKSLADEILKTLPKHFFDIFKIACYIVIGYVLYYSLYGVSFIEIRSW